MKRFVGIFRDDEADELVGLVDWNYCLGGMNGRVNRIMVDRVTTTQLYDNF